ncbi:ATP-binding cassette domain-containing protein [Lignipirellula cremea]|uniref:ABC transporter ATP-binding protein YxdL n=1 Tax=Lignipirellula cremea TaxID=2528010 RepID=A0A518E486_9BACT|nr:ATP-binding cassette domain-containing protein [Lignipirellula cremea]QDU98887.1 ABC transporter ATP-binding protein YxdL [Lignipirellula cremea]
MTASDASSCAIEAKCLTKIYGSGNTEVIAMRDATMQVKQGEVVALLGPGGSGKSTFLPAVGLINPPTSGRIAIRGRLVLDGETAHARLRSFRRRHIRFIFQKSNLIPFLTAVENIRIAIELFAKVAHEQGAGVIVVTHDHRALDVFDTIYEMGRRTHAQAAERPATGGSRTTRC